MEVTLGHSLASARAELVVTSRQLLPPNPSVNPSLIFFGPHHDGTADAFADDVGLADDVAATNMTAPQAIAVVRSKPPFFLLMNPPSLPFPFHYSRPKFDDC